MAGKGRSLSPLGLGDGGVGWLLYNVVILSLDLARKARQASVDSTLIPGVLLDVLPTTTSIGTRGVFVFYFSVSLDDCSWGWMDGWTGGRWCGMIAMRHVGTAAGCCVSRGCLSVGSMARGMKQDDTI